MFTSGGGNAFCPNGVLIHQRDKKDFSVARVICRSGSLSPSRLRARGCITMCGAWRPRSRKSTKTLKRFRLGRSGNSSSARKCRALVATLNSHQHLHGICWGINTSWKAGIISWVYRKQMMPRCSNAFQIISFRTRINFKNGLVFFFVAKQG